jgi:plastocyanin
MRIPRHPAVLLTLSLLVTAALVTSCSDNTTSPIGGGGGVKELDSGNLPTGRVFTHTFAGLGTFNYSCTIHGPTMAGQVIVVNGAADSAFVAIGDNFYNPTPVSVKPGGTVRWLNGGTTHTVTSP